MWACPQSQWIVLTDAFYKSICPSVCLCVRPFNIFLPPLPLRNPWGKVMKRSCLRFEHFCSKKVLNRRSKKNYWFFKEFVHFEVPFKRLFAPTFRNWMSNIFRDSESLGKGFFFTDFRKKFFTDFFKICSFLRYR